MCKMQKPRGRPRFVCTDERFPILKAFTAEQKLQQDTPTYILLPLSSGL